MCDTHLLYKQEGKKWAPARGCPKEVSSAITPALSPTLIRNLRESIAYEKIQCFWAFQSSTGRPRYTTRPGSGGYHGAAIRSSILVQLFAGIESQAEASPYRERKAFRKDFSSRFGDVLFSRWTFGIKPIFQCDTLNISRAPANASLHRTAIR